MTGLSFLGHLAGPNSPFIPRGSACFFLFLIISARKLFQSAFFLHAPMLIWLSGNFKEMDMEKDSLNLKKEMIVEVSDQESLKVKGGIGWTRIIFGTANLISGGVLLG